jgi:outer membrane immunogenic protein
MLGKLMLTTVFKTVAAAVAALVANALPCAAQTLPARVNWAGLYLGLQAGGGFGENCITGEDRAVTGCPFVRGETFGGHIGYNWQFSSLVLGAEASGAWSNLSGEAVPSSPQSTRNSRISSVSTAVMRAGYVWNETLFYTKLGAALIDERFSRTCQGAFAQGACLPVGTESVAGRHQRVGFVLGGGAEMFLMRNLSLGIDYAYIGTPEGKFVETPTSTGFGCGNGPGQSCAARVSESLSVITARLNWHLN